MARFTSTTVVYVLGLLLAQCADVFVSAQCSADLVVDNFAGYGSNLNSLGFWTSDDGTMTSISAASNKLSFTPNQDSYFYTTFDCINAPTQGLGSVKFDIKGPAGSSFTLELQSSSSCASTAYQSYFHTVTGLTGSTQTITVPLSAFSGLNAGALKAIVWSVFSGTGGRELSNVRFACTTPSQPTGTTASSTVTVTPTVVPNPDCSLLVIDEFPSQSRLTFLGYNAFLQSTSDDGTMQSLVVSGNRLTITPKANGYFYSNLPCTDAVTLGYGGISLRIKAPAGANIDIQLSSSNTCNAEAAQDVLRSSQQLGWTFDGTEKLYSIPFSAFSGLNTGKLVTILFGGLTRPITIGPMAFYCGNEVTEYVPPSSPVDPPSTNTVPITTAAPTSFIIDVFTNPDSNALGFYHGGDEGLGMQYSGGKLTITSDDTDYSWYTTLSASCIDFSAYEDGYLHIAYTGSNEFTIALQQHNSACNPELAPFPETWDVVEARRYATATDIYVPIKHFKVVKSRVIGFALKAFYSQTRTPTIISKIEILNTVSGVSIPDKIPTAPLYFACTRPNSFAFAIDDGVPNLAQEVLNIIREEDVKVTFFTVGQPLLDPSTNFSNVYTEMLSRGHQVALHSFTHPKMEGLPTAADIDWELNQDINAVAQALGITSKYFRPPFGNEGARMRQRLEAVIPGVKIINWSVDVEDWLWAETSTPEKQLQAFQRDVNKGGNLVVLHYLYPSTVSYLREFIQRAKATGKQLMRVDQCMEDPDAPPL